MTEKPLDRLNYFNGQRLEASDLKTEQEYHIRVRRWLNKSLYSPGIARGLEVRKVEDEPAVMVSPGLALDAQGREIILWEEQKVQISSEARRRPGNSEAEVEGLYLTIRYSEEVTAVEKDGCEAVGGTTRGDHPAWGGPTRVRARAIFEQRDFLPPESSGEVMLALVELTDDCSEVHQIDVGVRRYVGAASAAKVRQYALEGEKHIDPSNPGRIYFHIRGRQPSSVILYLRAERFSTLYYTELGLHDHVIDVTVDPITIPGHRHTITPDATTGGTGPSGNHAHNVDDIRAQVSGPLTSPAPWGFTPFIPTGTREASLKVWAGMKITLLGNGTHWHSMPGSTDPEPAKPFPLSGTGSSRPRGASDQPARPGPPEKALTYVDDLQVLIGPDLGHDLPLSADRGAVRRTRTAA